jgi:hypothetical protein
MTDYLQLQHVYYMYKTKDPAAVQSYASHEDNVYCMVKMYRRCGAMYSVRYQWVRFVTPVQLCEVS